MVMTQRVARRRKGDVGAHVAGEPANDNGQAADRPAGRPATPPAPLGPAEEAEQHDTVKYILEQAPPRVRRALRLSYWDQWPIQGIAAHLGVSRFALAREIRAFSDTMNKRLGDG
jgi:DNA-directed RNA polymerase specialized sigma24 family protein